MGAQSLMKCRNAALDPGCGEAWRGDVRRLCLMTAKALDL